MSEDLHAASQILDSLLAGLSWETRVAVLTETAQWLQTVADLISSDDAGPAEPEDSEDEAVAEHATERQFREIFEGLSETNQRMLLLVCGQDGPYIRTMNDPWPSVEWTRLHATLTQNFRRMCRDKPIRYDVRGAREQRERHITVLPALKAWIREHGENACGTRSAPSPPADTDAVPSGPVSSTSESASLLTDAIASLDAGLQLRLCAIALCGGDCACSEAEQTFGAWKREDAFGGWRIFAQRVSARLAGVLPGDVVPVALSSAEGQQRVRLPAALMEALEPLMPAAQPVHAPPRPLARQAPLAADVNWQALRRASPKSLQAFKWQLLYGDTPDACN